MKFDLEQLIQDVLWWLMIMSDICIDDWLFWWLVVIKGGRGKEKIKEWIENKGYVYGIGDFSKNQLNASEITNELKNPRN